jgi:dipeptidase
VNGVRECFALKRMSAVFKCFLVFCAFCFASFSSTAACTGIAIGKNATADGSVIITRNEDYDVNNWAKHMVVHLRKVNKAGTIMTFPTGLKVPASKISYKYTAMPDWDAKDLSTTSGPFAEEGINQYMVAMTATFSADTNKRAQAAEPFVKVGIEESVMPTLILPRVKTARQGVKLLGQFINRYGAAEADVIFFADKQGAWVFEMGAAHAWVAERVPDGRYIMMANALRLTSIDLTDHKNVIASPGLYQKTVKNRLLAHPSKTHFNFAAAYGVLGKPYNNNRIWLGEKIMTPSLKQSTALKTYPDFLKPDHKITLSKIITMMRANYKGTVLAGIAKRPIAVDRNIESHILQIRPYVISPLSGLIWQSLGNVADSVFVPVYAAITHTPDTYHVGTNQYGSRSAYWAFRGASALAEANNNEFMPILHSYWRHLQGQFFARQPYVDSMLTKMYKQNKQAALSFANFYSNSAMRLAVHDAKKIRGDLITAITKNTETGYTQERLRQKLKVDNG